MWYLCKKKLFCLWTFSASFFTVVAPFTIEIDSMKKKFKFHVQVSFQGPPSEPIKLPSPLIGILSEFSSSWKVPNVDSTHEKHNGWAAYVGEWSRKFFNISTHCLLLLPIVSEIFEMQAVHCCRYTYSHK